MERELRLMAKGKKDKKEGKVNEVMEDKEDHHHEKKVGLIGLRDPKAKVEEDKEKESSDDHQTQVSKKQVVVEEKCHGQENNNAEVGGWEKYGVGWTPWSCEEEQACWMNGDCFHCLGSAAAAAQPPNHHIAPDHGDDAAWEVSLWNFQDHM